MTIRKIQILVLYAWKLFSVVDYADLFRSFPLLIRRLNLGRAWLSRDETTGFPTNVVIELTNACNLDCVMCPSQKQTRKKGFLSKEDFSEMLLPLAGKLEIIEFAFMGETLIHPEFDWFIRHAKSLGIKTSINTNASFLNEANSLRLIEAGLDHLIISIDDASGGSYEQIRKGAQFSRTLENTRNFLRLNQGRVYTVIQKIHMSVNRQSTWDYVEEFLPLGANLVRLKPFRDLDPAKHHLRVNASRDVTAIQCPYLWRSPVVTWEGVMVPCNRDYDASMPMGDFRQPGGLAGAWDGTGFKRMRRLHAEGGKEHIDLCKGCSAIDVGTPSLMASTLLDGLNFRKVLSVFQTLKILLAAN